MTVAVESFNPPIAEVVQSAKQMPSDVDYPGATSEFLKGTSVSLSIDSLFEASGVNNAGLGIDQSLVGVMSFGEDDKVGIIRVVSSKDGKPGIALSKMKRDTDQTGERADLIAYLAPGNFFDVGRQNINPDNPKISRNHMTLEYTNDGKLVVKDGSTNGTDLVTFGDRNIDDKKISPKGLKRFMTKIKGTDSPKTVGVSDFISDQNGWSIKSQVLANAVRPEDNVHWDYTVYGEELLNLRKEQLKYEEPYVDQNGNEVQAKYQGREIIGRNSRINGGVYIVPGIQEAIVVDDARDGPHVFSEYTKANQRFGQVARAKGISIQHHVKEGQEPAVLESAWETAKELLKYDLQYSIDISRRFKDRKIDLSTMLEDGKGVCRHQALLAGYLLEKAIVDGYMRGKVSVDRNFIEGKGGHAWTRYTDTKGRVFIIDPAQNFVGTLEEATKFGGWDYRRPEEK